MKIYLIVLLFVFAQNPFAAAGEISIQNALDVIKWARFGNKEFSSAYADQELLSKKSKFVLYGQIYDKMAKEGKIPKGYSVVNNEGLKKVDWSTTGCISIFRLPDGRVRISGSLGPLGSCSYWLTLKDGKYFLKSAGGS
jgi:hypothetical protein